MKPTSIHDAAVRADMASQAFERELAGLRKLLLARGMNTEYCLLNRYRKDRESVVRLLERLADEHAPVEESA